MKPAPRLLTIDDNADSAQLIVRIATKCGYEARAIYDLDGLAEVIAGWNPDIVTLDLCMPQDDGIAVLSMLNSSGFRGRLAIISGQEGWLRKAAGRLAAAHGLQVIADLAKPIQVAQFRELLVNASAQ